MKEPAPNFDGEREAPAWEPADRLRYQEVFDFAPEGYVLTDRKGLTEAVNYSAGHLLGTRRDYLIGKPFPLLFSQPERSKVYGLVTRLLTTSLDDMWEGELRLTGSRLSPTTVNVNVAV